MANNYFVSGQWNAICDSCGKRYKIRDLRKRWDGLLVCEKDYELDHPQKYLRVRETGQAVPIIRDEPQDNFKFVCDIVSIQPLAEWGTAGCATVGQISPIFIQHGDSFISGIGIAGIAIPGYWSTIPGSFCYTDSVALPNYGFASCMIAETP